MQYNASSGWLFQRLRLFESIYPSCLGGGGPPSYSAFRHEI